MKGMVHSRKQFVTGFSYINIIHDRVVLTVALC